MASLISQLETSFPVVNSFDYDVDNAPLHYLVRTPGNRYDQKTTLTIQYLYIFSSILWIFIIFFLKFYLSGPVGWIFLIIPLAIFGVNLDNAKHHTQDVEDDMFQGNFFSFGYLIILFLINWEKVKFKKRLFTILMAILILILFSIYDVWLPKKKIIYVKHFRSILQTLALSLLAYALYVYYEGIVYYDEIEDKS